MKTTQNQFSLNCGASKNNPLSVNRARQVVIVGLVGSIFLAILALVLIETTITRCHQASWLFGETEGSPWYEPVPLKGDIFKPIESFPSAYAPHRLQFSTKKFLSSSEGRGVIMLVIGSAGFMAVAGYGYKVLSRKTGSSSDVSSPP